MPNKAKTDLSADEVRALLDYDQKTGIFRWRYNAARSKEWNTRRAGKPAGGLNKTIGRIQVRIQDRGLYLASRLAWLYVTGEWPEHEIDHVNQDKTDDRFDNLRLASRIENMRNRKVHDDSRSGFLGVRWRKHHRKWEARISIAGKTVWHAYAESAQEAAALRREAALLIHGEFAAHG